MSEPSTIRIEASRSRPDLSVELQDAARLKIAFRKVEYSMGEMMVLDVAVLNVLGEPVFVPSVSSIEIRASSGNKRPTTVNRYTVSDGFKPYVHLSDGRLEHWSMRIVIGCSEELFDLRDQLWSSLSDAETFDKGLFTSLGDGCLNVKRGDAIELTAELANKDVVITENSTRTRTATGSLTSNYLRLKVR